MNNLRIFLAYLEAVRGTPSKSVSEILLRELDGSKSNVLPNLPLSMPTLSRVRHGGQIDHRHHGTLNFAMERYLIRIKFKEESESQSAAFERMALIPEVATTLGSWESGKKAIRSLTGSPSDLLPGVWQNINITTYGSDIHGSKFNQQMRSTLRHIYWVDGRLKSESLGVSTLWTGEVNYMGQFVHIVEAESGSIAHGERAYSIYAAPRPSAERDMDNYRFIIEGFVLTVVAGVWHDASRKEHIFTGKNVMRKLPKLTQRYKNSPREFMHDRKALIDKYCNRWPINETLMPVGMIDRELEIFKEWQQIIRIFSRKERGGILDGGDFSTVD